jgi:hypothetical protein
VVVGKGGALYVCGLLGDAGGYQASLMKLTAGGKPAWSAPRTCPSPFHGDYAERIARGPSGSLYTIGSSQAANGMDDCLLIKWSSSGAVQWARRYDGPGHGDDWGECLGVDPRGNVTIACSSSNDVDGNDLDWQVISYSPKGAERWSWRYGDPLHLNDRPIGLVVAKDGGVYVTGWVRTAAQATSVLTVRLSPSGGRLWQQAYAGTEGNAAVRAAVPRPEGGIYACGTTLSAGTGWDGLVLGYRPDGTRVAFDPDTGSGGERQQDLSSLAVTSTGQVVAVGIDRAPEGLDSHLAIYKKSGKLAETITIPEIGTQDLDCVAAGAFGGYVATGYSNVAAGRREIITMRGSVIPGGAWWTSFWSPAFVSQSAAGHAVIVKGSRAIVVGSCQPSAEQLMDQVVLGYAY